MAFRNIFEAGFRLFTGDLLNRAISYPSLAFAGPLTALNGGTVATSPLLTETISHVGTVAGAGHGVALPPAVAGAVRVVINAGANSMQVFARGGSTINGTAGATGVAQAAGVSAIYVAGVNGLWRRILSA